MRQSKLLAVMLALTTAVFIFSVSVAVPILVRPIYYAHIDLLELEEAAGLDREQIILAYNEVMDYCTGKREDFSAGGLPWSRSGRDHFEDVRGLFLLDLSGALLSGCVLLGWALLRSKCSVRPQRFLGRGFEFWGSAGLCSVFVLIGGLAALNFERAFIVFHKVAFPGKDNWYFDPNVDGVIRILPQAFFRNCAVIILGLMLLLCLLFVLFDLVHTHKKASDA